MTSETSGLPIQGHTVRPKMVPRRAWHPPILVLTPISFLFSSAIVFFHSGKHLKQTSTQHFWPVKRSNPSGLHGKTRKKLPQAFRAFVDPELRKWVERTWPGCHPTDPTGDHPFARFFNPLSDQTITYCWISVTCKVGHTPILWSVVFFYWEHNDEPMNSEYIIYIY